MHVLDFVLAIRRVEPLLPAAFSASTPAWERERASDGPEQDDDPGVDHVPVPDVVVAEGERDAEEVEPEGHVVPGPYPFFIEGGANFSLDTVLLQLWFQAQ